MEGVYATYGCRLSFVTRKAQVKGYDLNVLTLTIRSAARNETRNRNRGLGGASPARPDEIVDRMQMKNLLSSNMYNSMVSNSAVAHTHSSSVPFHVKISNCDGHPQTTFVEKKSPKSMHSPFFFPTACLPLALCRADDVTFGRAHLAHPYHCPCIASVPTDGQSRPHFTGNNVRSSLSSAVIVT
jgi:hypothetical protein